MGIPVRTAVRHRPEEIDSAVPSDVLLQGSRLAALDAHGDGEFDGRGFTECGDSGLAALDDRGLHALGGGGLAGFRERGPQRGEFRVNAKYEQANSPQSSNATYQKNSEAARYLAAWAYREQADPCRRQKQ